MTKLTELLSESSKADWAEVYKQLTGKDWKLPKKGRSIDFPKTESISEIDRFMREKANPTERK